MAHQKNESNIAVDQRLDQYTGLAFKENPLDFFIMLARYKFMIRFLKKTDTVIDAGCGFGYGSVLLSKYCKNITGVDFAAKHVAQCTERYGDIPNVSFKQINLLDISKYKTRYDALISLDVIEHFTKKQTHIVAKNYAKLLKPNGFALIGTPSIHSKPYASAWRLSIHKHEFKPEEFKNLLEQHFKRVFLFSMTDEVVSQSFPEMAWYLMALCVK